ncbi:MAG: amidohydrolase [Synergistaceae bacterium]|jgi:amidohydrolase|nr:amidohydrolase [Synergistaceae bacterium]
MDYLPNKIIEIKKSASLMSEEIIATRRHFHRNPEMSWRETETSLYIARRLEEWGLTDVRRGFGGTESGVVADLAGDAPGPCVALRADIDALPVFEKNDADWRSQNLGVMHACGHDAHMSALLAAAKILAAMKPDIRGRIRFIFQPAEEIGAPSGARAMIGEGVLDGVDAIGGMHVWSFVRAGLVQWKSGPVMASSDRFDIKFTGMGGHGAMPHDAIDPFVPTAAFVHAVQTIASREINPLEAVVVSIGKIAGGAVHNIIPDEVEIYGSIRAFNPEIRRTMEDRLRRVADGIASAHRCQCEVKVEYLVPSVTNDAPLTEVFRRAAVLAVGEGNVGESPHLMVSEDFSFFQEKIPGTFFFLGVGNPAIGADYPHHSPLFTIDESVLATGAALYAAFGLSALESLKSGLLKAHEPLKQP